MAQTMPVTSVHDALQRAVLSESNRVAMVNANFKVDPGRKSVAETICEKNGTTLSAYLRECTDGLIIDYAGPKVARDLGIYVED